MLVSGFHADNIDKGGGIFKDAGSLTLIVKGFLEAGNSRFLVLFKGLVDDFHFGGDEEGFAFWFVGHREALCPFLGLSQEQS